MEAAGLIAQLKGFAPSPALPALLRVSGRGGLPHLFMAARSLHRDVVDGSGWRPAPLLARGLPQPHPVPVLGATRTSGCGFSRCLALSALLNAIRGKFTGVLHSSAVPIYIGIRPGSARGLLAPKLGFWWCFPASSLGDGSSQECLREAFPLGGLPAAPGMVFGQERDPQSGARRSHRHPSRRRISESAPSPCWHCLFLAFPDIFSPLDVTWGSQLHPALRGPGPKGLRASPNIAR